MSCDTRYTDADVKILSHEWYIRSLEIRATHPLSGAGCVARLAA